jgi:hypothetical protein
MEESKDSGSQNESIFSLIDSNVLRKKKISTKQKLQALKYLQESRKDLMLTHGEKHSGFSQRIQARQRQKSIS